MRVVCLVIMCLCAVGFDSLCVVVVFPRVCVLCVNVFVCCDCALMGDVS